jgi:hypothetical protein
MDCRSLVPDLFLGRGYELPPMTPEFAAMILDKFSIVAFWGESSTMFGTLLSTILPANREHGTAD